MICTLKVVLFYYQLGERGWELFCTKVGYDPSRWQSGEVSVYLRLHLDKEADVWWSDNFGVNASKANPPGVTHLQTKNIFSNRFKTDGYMT